MPTPGMRPASTRPNRPCSPWRSRWNTPIEASARVEERVDAALEFTVEPQYRGIGEGQHLGHYHAGDAAHWVEPVIAVEDASPADRPGAAAVRPRCHVEHIAETPAERRAGEEIDIVR